MFGSLLDALLVAFQGLLGLGSYLLFGSDVIAPSSLCGCLQFQLVVSHWLQVFKDTCARQQQSCDVHRRWPVLSCAVRWDILLTFCLERLHTAELCGNAATPRINARLFVGRHRFRASLEAAGYR